MEDVITLSSDSDEDQSGVEVVGSCSNIMTKPDPLPLTAVRVYVDAVNVNVPTVSLQITTLPLVYKLAVTIVIFRRRANLVDLNHCLYRKTNKNRFSYITGNFSLLTSTTLSQVVKKKFK